MHVHILGCGVSSGVPLIGNKWGRCDPNNPKNKRRRASILCVVEGRHILIDTSPDLRLQLLDAGVSHIDAVLYTHAHADHLHGLNDLCVVSRLANKPIPVFAPPQVLSDIKKSFAYAFDSESSFYTPFLQEYPITDTYFTFAGIDIHVFEQNHGYSTSYGYRLGNFTYSTDVNDFKSLSPIIGTHTWVVDCLRRSPHPTHAHLDKTLEWIKEVKPKRAFLTHLSPYMDYDELCKELPLHVRPCYDGLSFTV